MSFLTSLHKAYNYALEHDLVDRHDKDETVILPIYHNNMQSNGKNILNISLDNNADLVNVQYIPDKQRIIFPVSEDSVARSGNNPLSHPLVDKISYLSKIDEKKHEMYVNELKAWINFEKEGDIYDFLMIIHKFVTKSDIFKSVVEFLYSGNNYVVEEFDVKITKVEKNGKDKIITDKFKDVFVTFTVVDFTDNKNFSVTDYIDLHKSYINYIDSLNTEKEICNISEELQRISAKHRGILGNAKVISTSNNKETYIGRFSKGSDVIRVGYKTSEKMHLMLKFFLENKNSSKWLSSGQYLINWFSDDLKNESELELTNPNNSIFEDISLNTEGIKMVNSLNADIGNSFIQGQVKFSENSDFYLAIIDKASNGRISIKYFKNMKASELVTNLKKWQNNYYWYWFDSSAQQNIKTTSSMYQILKAAYGVERNKSLEVDNDSLLKDQYQKLTISLVEGLPMPKNITKMIDINIRKRLSYKETWNKLCLISMSVLNNGKKGEYTYMLDIENLDRSYLFGRLLAIYDYIERSTYSKTNDALDERLTNVDKYWTAYVNKPATTLVALSRSVKPYENKLKVTSDKAGLFYKADKFRTEIVGKIDESYRDTQQENRPLEYNFIYGYYAQKRALFTKTDKEEI